MHIGGGKKKTKTKKFFFLAIQIGGIRKLRNKKEKA